MSNMRLTGLPGPATSERMVAHARRSGMIGRRLRSVVMVALMSGCAMISGCISVNAPDKPIVIELNINIKQEVIYRLAADAQNTIEQNEDIF